MFYEKSSNTQSHNWLIHHYYVRQVRKHSAYVQGRVLDIGCGRKPYYPLLANRCHTYIGLDYLATTHGLQAVDVLGTALTLPFADRMFDAVVSFQVMEHVPDPCRFLAEAFRVLRPGGAMLLATPFLWREHEQPRDYYRFTRYGLRYLAETAGFDALAIEPDTGYWGTAVLHFNYWLARFGKGPLRYFLLPIWLDQYLALLLDRLDRRHTVDTAGFTTLLMRPP